VERVGAGSDRPAAVASGSDLAVGDRVVTGTDGRALITFLDGTTVTVEPASDVTVRQAQMEGRQASRVGVLVTVGTVWARVAGWLGGRGHSSPTRRPRTGPASSWRSRSSALPARRGQLERRERHRRGPVTTPW